MKRLLLFLSAVFIATTAIAEQITINFGADNKHYTTTTCEIGNDVILPTPPTKRGYTFRGWKKDSFNRGTWANWQEVPNDENSYPEDFYGNRTPMTNDYIVVVDANLYISGDFGANPRNVVVVRGNGPYDINIIINGVVTRYNYTSMNNVYIQLTDWLSIKYSPGAPGHWKIKTTNTYFNNNEVKTQANDTTILSTSASAGTAVYLSEIPGVLPEPLSGTWRFVYKGFWAKDGKIGWKPETQITE